MVSEKVKQIISAQLNIPVEKVTDDSVVVEGLGADSLDMVELLMAFEDEFKISISDEDATGIKTVNDIVKFIESKI